MNHIAVIGSSPINILFSVLLAIKGFKVTLFEHRSALGGVWCGDSSISCFDNTPHIINLTKYQHKFIQDLGISLNEDLAPSFMILATDDLSSRLAIATYNNFWQSLFFSFTLLQQRSHNIVTFFSGLLPLLKRYFTRMISPYKSYIPAGGWPSLTHQLYRLVHLHSIHLQKVSICKIVTSSYSTKLFDSNLNCYEYDKVFLTSSCSASVQTDQQLYISHPKQYITYHFLCEFQFFNKPIPSYVNITCPNRIYYLCFQKCANTHLYKISVRERDDNQVDYNDLKCFLSLIGLPQPSSTKIMQNSAYDTCLLKLPPFILSDRLHQFSYNNFGKDLDLIQHYLDQNYV